MEPFRSILDVDATDRAQPALERAAPGAELRRTAHDRGPMLEGRVPYRLPACPRPAEAPVRSGG